MMFITRTSWEVPLAIVVKVRDGQVRNKPTDVVIRVTAGGERHILGRRRR